MSGFNSFDDKDVDINMESQPNDETTNQPNFDKNESIKLDDSIDDKKEQQQPKQNKKKPNSERKELPPKTNENLQVSNQPDEQPKKNNKDYQTLEESVADSLKRDIIRIYHKLKHVLLPKFAASKKEELQNWDLWGPLIICLLLCLTLTVGGNNSNSTTFVIVFFIIWIGGICISMNAQFLGAKIGICQTICLLGYCVFPIFLAALIIAFINTKHMTIKLILIAIGFVWSCLSSIGFMSGLVVQDKKLITVIPVFLFYLFLCGFVLNY